MRAASAGVLDRALDVAAALEVRGYGARAPARRGASRPWSRHDLAFAASAVAIAGARGRGAGRPACAPFHAYPSLHAPVGRRRALGLAVGAARSCALLPFADRRGIAR